MVWDSRPVSPETIGQRVKLLRDAVRIQGWLGSVYRELHDHVAAARHFGNPMNPFARQAYAGMLMVVSPEDAIAVARQTTRMLPREIAAWQELATVYFFQRRHADRILATGPLTQEGQPVHSGPIRKFGCVQGIVDKQIQEHGREVPGYFLSLHSPP